MSLKIYFSFLLDRIDVCTFDIIQFENVSLSGIENDFQRSHKTCPINTLASLQDFFKMLLQFPCANYLLRYDPKYREKLMVYREATDRFVVYFGYD